MSKTKQLALLYHNLAILFDAGMPVIRSLDTIAANSQGSLKKIFTRISKSVSQGSNLADSMVEHSRFFAKLDIRLIAAAEYAGRLPQCFHLLTKWYEFLLRIHRIMLSGFMLPLTIFHIVVPIVSLPQFVSGNIDTRQFLTKVLESYFALYLSVILAIIIYRLMRKVNFLSYLLDFFVLLIPVLGSGIRHLSICRYSRAFNMLYKSGVPIMESLTTAGELAGNRVVSGLFKGGAKNAAAGKPAWQGFSRRLPLEYTNLWLTGEESGELDKTVDKIAEIAGDKAELLLTEFAKWLPRIFYFILCLWMAGKILSGYSGLYSFEGL
jgi:type IV pilus assembly protein PilC